MSGRGRVYPPLAERLQAQTDRTPGHGPFGDCWLWTGYKVKFGYGQIHPGKDTGRPLMYTHRAAYEIAFSVDLGLPRETGILVLHRCDTPSCVNPAHLFLGTAKDNAQDMLKKRRKVSAYQKGESNNANRIPARTVREIRKFAGTHQDAADNFGISLNWAWQIRTGRAWTHI